MAQNIYADASPEKRLFISLLTRDIPLVAAMLDLLDNSINAAVEPFADQLETAADYSKVFQDETINPRVTVSLTFSETEVRIVDDASGISTETAEKHVFKFGRGSLEPHEGDRLSVYGLGLKRAIFKLGNAVTIQSEHSDGGFDLNLDVGEWERDPTVPWTFAMTARSPVDNEQCGTSIVVQQLYDDVSRRLTDGVFEGQLRDVVSKTYAYYIAKFVTIEINGKAVHGLNTEIGSNHASDELTFNDVTCAITAGLGTPEGGLFRERSSGWFVFCNGRVVISADKSALTGWGSGLPMFQPKHRPFLGTVFFVSKDPEQLPWTTTKSAINEDSALWQLSKRKMVAVGKLVVSFLDGRYTDEGTEVASEDLRTATGQKMSVLSAAVAPKRGFKAPPPSKAPTTIRIQYDALVPEVKKIVTFLKRPGMSGSDVGRHTFSYFLRNHVEDE